MERTEEQIFDLILEVLYHSGDYVRLTPSFLHEQEIQINDCEYCAKRLQIQGICDVSFNQKIPYIKLTKHGIEIIQMYGSYSQFLESKRREIKVDMQTKVLTKHNIKLNNWKLSIALIVATVSLIISIIAMIKNSNKIDELKELLHKNNIEIPE